MTHVSRLADMASNPFHAEGAVFLDGKPAGGFAGPRARTPWARVGAARLLPYPMMPKEERPRNVAVVFTGRAAEADLIRFILKEAGIACWLDAEPGAGPLQPVKVLVAPEDAERAKAEIRRSREDETVAD
jgi:hypothetical protein